MSYSYPTRSRSRSPPRGGPPGGRPYDPGYGLDSYRGGEWDQYDRDRGFYDRYDYPRRRSHTPEEGGRKRRRSPSPYDRDRFDPRPRYNDDYDTHSRSYAYSPPGRGRYPPNRRPPPDPHTFDYPASLKQFADWFRYYYPQQAVEEDNADKAAEQEAGDGSKPRNGIKSKWEQYKKTFAANQLQVMFEHHRKSPWFAEKYDPSPEYEKLRQRVRKEGWRGRVQTFLNDLEMGKYDPSNETGSTEAKENGHGNAEDTAGAAPEEDFNMDEDEDKGMKGRGEELSVDPEGNEVMIRTIPPDIGRVKLEEACRKIPGFLHLALGDPLQKRNYYRAGWIKISDDADMSSVMTQLSDTKIEGFKLHVTHNTRPFKNRARQAPEVASKPQRLEHDLIQIKKLATILEDEAAALRKFSPEPVKPKAGEGEDTAMDPSTEEEPEEEEPPERGSDVVERRVEKIMSELRDQGLVDVNDAKNYELKKTTVALDLYLAYLRASYHTCYYCSVVTDHLEELQRKCLKHGRKPLSKLLLDEVKAAEAAEARKYAQQNEDGDQDQPSPTEETAPELGVDGEKKEKAPAGKKQEQGRDWKRNDEKWLDWLDSKVALLINRNGIDPRDYGGKSYDEELSKAVEPHIKQEDEGKFRCKLCSKLFKATSFVEKHVANKHADQLKTLDDIPYFNNFALDPHRIQPFTHPPPNLGNSTQAPPQAYGIQGPATWERYDSRPYGGNWGEYPPPGGGYYNDPPRRERDDGLMARRLSDRLGGFAEPPANAGLPPKPPPSALDMPLSAGGPRKRNNQSNGGSSGGAGGPPPPPPPNAKEDPRAAAGRRVSYHDMDLVAEGDVELFY